MVYRKAISDPIKSVFNTSIVNGNSGPAPVDALIMEVDTTIVSGGSTASNQFEIPMLGVTDFDVDWGDGNEDLNQTGTITHTYSLGGVYTITVSGNDYNLRFNNGGDKDKLIEVQSLGSVNVVEGAFWGCSNMDITATDSDATISSLNSVFRECSSLTYNSSINNWDVSSVTDGLACFFNSSFNQPIGDWNVSSLTNASSMFRNCPFNQDINSWNVSSVTLMGSMFNGNSDFNQDISSWNVSNVSNMSSIFNNCSSFNQNLGNWTISSASNVTSMFNNSGIDVTNYDSILVAWDAKRASLPSFLTIGVNGLNYTAAGAGGIARLNLIVNNFWAFIGDTGV